MRIRVHHGHDLLHALNPPIDRSGALDLFRVFLPVRGPLVLEVLLQRRPPLFSKIGAQTFGIALALGKFECGISKYFCG